MTESGASPWLTRPEWEGGRARGSSARDLLVHWLAAVVWNTLAVPMTIGLLRGAFGELGVYLSFVLPLFALTGVLIFYQAVRETVRWHRFRNIELQLDPFPGSLGGQAGGSVELPIRPGDGLRATVTLLCIRSSVRRSRDRRERRDDVLWSKDAIPDVGGVGSSTRLRFTFDLPAGGVPESEPRSDDYTYWAVRLTAALPGADLNRTFEVPIFAVDPPLRADDPVTAVEPDPFGTLGGGITAEPTGGGARITYARGRGGAAGFMIILFGLVFGGGGVFFFSEVWGMRDQGDMAIVAIAFSSMFLVVFGTVGLAMVGAGLYALLNRLEVEVGDGRIRTVRSILPFKRRRQLEIEKLGRIEATVGQQSGQGVHARVTYTVRGIGPGGRKIPLGDGIRDAHRMDRIGRLLEQVTGVPVDMKVKKGRDG